LNMFPENLSKCCLFIFVYEAQNLPFFTWLLTGGIILFVLLQVLLKINIRRIVAKGINDE